MIIKYSEGKINEVVEPTKEDEDKFTKKTREALNNDENEIVKEASNDNKPFWVKK